MQEELDQQVDDLKKFHNTADGRVQIWFGLRTIFNNTDDLIVRTKELADQYRVGVHMHVAEAKSEIEYTKEVYGEPTVTHLHRLGVLDKNLLAVHTVWLTNEEVDLFKKYDVKVSHNPASAMRVLGFAKIPPVLCFHTIHCSFSHASYHSIRPDLPFPHIPRSLPAVRKHAFPA